MEIDKHPVPEAVFDALCGLADALKPALILASGEPALFQKHRVLMQNVPVARQSIKASLKKDRQLDPAIAALLRCDGLYLEVVAVLSEAALETGFSALAIYYGEAEFLAAALLDEREAVRKLAHDFIAGWDGNNSDDDRREQAATDISATFAPFLKNLQRFAVKALPPIARADQGQDVAEKNRHNKALESVKAELARLAKTSDREQKERKELQNQITARQQEIDRLLGDLLAAHKETRSLNGLLADTRQELADLHSSLQRRVEAGIDQALANKLRHWLEPVLKVEVAVAGAQGSDLLARSAAALEKQRAQDIHYGNRAELTRMIDQRRQMLTDVQRARIEALHPLPELTSIASELEREIGDLSRRLGPSDEHVSATVSGLLARINEATSLDALSEVRRFIQEGASYALLDGDELDRLYRATDKKAGLLYDRAELFGKDPSAPASKRFFLRHALAQGHSFTLFIDGHNVLYTLKDRFLRHFQDDHPGQVARSELANCLTSIFFRQGADVMLYFDGNEPAQQSLSDQVRVFYSGGTGAHRADEAILKHLMHYIHSDSSAPLCLVTNDADFARQASAMGVSIIHPEEFATSLDIGAWCASSESDVDRCQGGQGYSTMRI